jgi:hypothetical protein
VLVNGDTAGTTPINRYALDAGPVMLKVRKEGYSPLDTTVTAEAGGRVQLQEVALGEVPSGDATSDATLAEKSDPSANNQTATPADTEPTEPATDPSSSTETRSDGGTEATPDNQSASGGGSSQDREAETEAPAPNAATGIVQVTPKPSGTVLVDGEEQGGGGAITLTTGEHTVTCRHPRYGSVQTTVTVSEGQTEPLTCYFERTVDVTTQGPFGRIWLNGRNTGKNTNATLSLPPGDHRIEVRRKSLDAFRVNGGAVKVERGGEAEIENFSGQAYQIKVEPSFENVQYAISFKVDG